MKKILLAAVLCLGVGCQGKRGEKGEPGQNMVHVYEGRIGGTVSNDSFLVQLPDNPAAVAQVSVFISDNNGLYTALPYGTSYAMYSAGTNPPSSWLEIYNAISTGALNYRAVVVLR